MVQQLTPSTDDILYPESDGKPLADNTLQFELITTIKYGLEALFKDDPNVFVAGDLLWYPELGKPKINQAPDVMVVVGRPKGHRR
ncbi:MAG: Uma2 family endonuclease, partial [Moorea sp. SIO3B2]|nr:Uma2 family endonuclease [Moorena sp. SIO3B2]